jgi:hypothetical protein
MFATSPPQPNLHTALAGSRRQRRALDRWRGNHRLRGLGLRLTAAWHSPALDRELAAGVDPQTSAVLAIRARRLIVPRSRKQVANGLAGAIRSAKDTRPGITAAVRPNPRELLDARTVLAVIERRLRGSGAIAAQGVAMLGVLLSDPASPLYRPTEAGALASSLRAAAAALQPSDQAPGTRRDGAQEGCPPHLTPERRSVLEASVQPAECGPVSLRGWR